MIVFVLLMRDRFVFPCNQGVNGLEDEEGGVLVVGDLGVPGVELFAGYGVAGGADGIEVLVDLAFVVIFERYQRCNKEQQ